MQSEIVLRFLSAVLIAFAGPISASHFRGAIFTWKPGSNPGNIIIGYRISWRMSYGHQVFCNDTFTKQEKSVDGEGNLECFDNCRNGSSTLGQLSYKCTDYSVNEDWSSGRGQISHTFVSEKHPPSSVFKFGFKGDDWIDTLVVGGGKWVIRATADLLPRRDNGKINSSPIAEILPIIRLQHGCNHTIRIGVVDPDKDILRCRWATASNNECGGICETFPNAWIHTSECTITYNAVYKTGLYAVAIQVEDYETINSSRPLSSVPVQFLVNVFQSNDTCTAKTEFVEPTPPDNACIAVPNGNVYESAIVTRRTSNSTRISEIKTVSPLGLSKSSLYRVNETDWRMNITFTPVPGGDQSNIFCFAAEDARGFESNERCITLIVGVSPPRFIDGLPSGTVDKSQRRWFLTADSTFTQATRQSGFIRMYNRTGHLVEAINTSDRNAVIFHTENKRLEFVTTSELTQREEYYFLIDPGIVKGSAFCGLESEGINNPAFWKIRITCPCVANQTEVCELESQTCQCNDGWTVSNYDKDINECLDFSACGNFSNTGCQNRDWGYDCLCLVVYQLRNNSCIEVTQTENSEMPGKKPINALEKETPIILHINIDIPNTDNLEVAVTYEKYKRKATLMLTNVYSEQLGDNFIYVIVHNVSAGSLIIHHTVVIKNSVEAKQDLAVTVHYLVQNTITIEFGNQKVTAKEAFVDAKKVTSACDAYRCEHTECATERNRPYCRALDEDEHSIDYVAIISSVSAAIVAIAAIIGVVYKCKTTGK